MKKKVVAALLAISMLGTVLGGISSQAAEDSEKKILRITQSSGAVIDPGTGADCASSMAYVNMYDSLVYTDMDNNSAPMLAESWETSEDGLTWTFKLKEGVKFHDGSDLHASDVVFSINRMLALGEGYAYLFTPYVESAEAPDETTVIFHLKDSFAPFLSILNRLYILNEDLVMANLADGSYGEFGDYGKAFLAENDAGSGAYKLTEMKTQDRICMEKFDDYFLGWEENAPEIVDIILTTETATVRTMMSTGEVQVSDQWQTNEAYEALDAMDGISIGSYSNGQMLYLMLNNKKAPTDDVHVRRALAYMVDYQQVREVLFPGYFEAVSVVPSGVFGSTDEGFQYEYNLDKAMEELQQSPYYEDIVSGQLPITLEWIADVPDEEKLALLVQATASALGVKVDVVKVPWATHVDNCGSVETTPNASVCFISSDYPEAGSMLYMRFDSDTAGTWQQTEWLQDEEVDEMIESALTTMDDTEREAKYVEIQKKASEECWAIPVAEQCEKHAYYDNIEVPAFKRAEAGESVALPLGYNYIFHDYKIN